MQAKTRSLSTNKKGTYMKKNWIISISLSLLIFSAGAAGYVQIKSDAAENIFSEPSILRESKKEEMQLDLKEIIRETQKKTVMVELADGTVGSGFLFNMEGDILTNAHVVAGTDEVKVRTTDAKGYDGKVIGISTETDVALVRVEGLKGQEPVRIAEEFDAELGQEILALGSPLGFQNTVTTGIISGTNRDFDLPPYTYKGVHQISAPIAPGNSGGPLIDRKTGQVVGMNSARMEDGEIGFSIPIKDILPIAKTWAQNPMKSLPAYTGLDDSGEMSENKKSETADYLVSYYIESLDFHDYVTAYSLLGSELQTKLTYEAFKEQFNRFSSMSIETITTEKSGEGIIVHADITVQPKKGGKPSEQMLKASYTVAYENEQAKIIDQEIKEDKR
ncbi:S1C family serine protease [Metabacillus indicus]|nr:trypsin-like peptidase domain-containing protein [Metabacillus indicus]